MNQLIPFRAAEVSPALIASAAASAQQRFFEFFTVNIRNRNTGRAYGIAVRQDRSKAPRRGGRT
jgi:hypothetical protein